MADRPGASRSKLRPQWSAGVHDEEARAYFQARMIVYSRLLFWSVLVLLAFIGVMYWNHPALAPEHNAVIMGFAAAGLAAMAAIWRGVLVRRPVSLRTLERIDLIYAMGLGLAFATSAALAPQLQAAAYVSLIFSYLTVFSRALVVPSTARRTAIVSAVALAWLTPSAIYLSLTAHQELPLEVFIGGSLLLNAVVVVVATAGTSIIYGLNQKVSEATQLGHYTLGRRIGEGGMGAVYHAHHLLLRRPTAIKLLLPERVGSPENLDRFEREVQHMSRLTHPNTVAVFDYGRSLDGVFYYAMEYLGGGTDLERLVQRFGPQPAGRVVDILAQVCGALQEAHDLGIIHRDIKPANIILCERGGMPDVAKVVDFGLVKEITADTGNSTQAILGTPHYVAPEVISDPDTLGPAADLYALGATGYFLLTGKRVFDGKTAIDICVQHLTVTPKRPSEISAIHIDPAFEALLMTCLAKRPEARPAAAAALAEALRALPVSRDWSPADARTWWREYRAAQVAQEEVASGPTQTITIDLDLHERASS